MVFTCYIWTCLFIYIYPTVQFGLRAAVEYWFCTFSRLHAETARRTKLAGWLAGVRRITIFRAAIYYNANSLYDDAQTRRHHRIAFTAFNSFAYILKYNARLCVYVCILDIIVYKVRSHTHTHTPIHRCDGFSFYNVSFLMLDRPRRILVTISAKFRHKFLLKNLLLFTTSLHPVRLHAVSRSMSQLHASTISPSHHTENAGRKCVTPKP